jgi:molybdate transport system regulatory protein
MTSTNRRERAHRGAGGRDEVALTLRIDVPTGRVGPGKIALLEQIAQLGSISAAARTLRMSYRRAWELVDDLGRSFGRPAVTTQMGGSGGGGATLTPLGRDLVAQYRAIERKAHRAARSHLARLQAARAGRP